MPVSYDDRACSRRAGGSSSRSSRSPRASPPRCRRSASFCPCCRTHSAGAAAPCRSCCRSASCSAASPRFPWGASPIGAARGPCWRGRGASAGRGVRYPRAAEPRRVVAASPRAARRSAFGDARLWFFVSAWCFLGLVFMMVTVHSVSYARDRGLPLEQASLALSAFGVGAVSGRLLAGAAADRFGAVPTMRVCLLIQLTALCALLVGLPTWTVVATLLLFGLGASGADNTFVKAVSDVFGLAALTTIMSVVGLGWRSGAGLGPAVAGFVYDVTGSYTPSFALGVLALAAGWVLFRRGSAPRAH